MTRAGTRPALTEREKMVLNLLAMGRTALQTAETLGITKRTVAAHTQRINSKLNASNGTHAVAIAIKEGIINISRSGPIGT